MKITENTLKPAAFLQKELRAVTFSEVTTKDFPDLYYNLVNLYTPHVRKNCNFQVLVNSNQIAWINSEKQLEAYVNGFQLAMALNGFQFSASVFLKAN